MTKGGIWQRGVLAAVASVVAAGALVSVGVAGAEAPADVYLHETNGPCFSTAAAAVQCSVGETADVAIATGESVTWHFDGSASNHNAAADNDVPADPTWKDFVGDFVTTGSYSRTFTQPGVYNFVCQAHSSTMKGTITVTGDPPATATPTPTPSTQPGGTPQTPPPAATTDTVKPTVRSIKLKAQHHAARVTFTLSENATVTIRVKRGKKVVKAVVVQARAGTRTVKVRSNKLNKGRYTIEVRARDAVGNSSTLAKKPLRFKK